MLEIILLNELNRVKFIHAAPKPKIQKRH
ncbi:MAG: hypothetical protein H6R31_331, partial [Methanomicrobia archaeon]|nr:hypothetical protein [Methanomicrobia archaeon]